MAEFVIPAVEPKFEGAPVHSLDREDLTFLLRKYRHHPVLGRALDFELRRRARAGRRQAERRGRRPRVFA